MLMIEAKLSFMLVELFELFMVFAITHMGFSWEYETNTQLLGSVTYSSNTQRVWHSTSPVWENELELKHTQTTKEHGKSHLAAQEQKCLNTTWFTSFNDPMGETWTSVATSGVRHIEIIINTIIYLWSTIDYWLLNNGSLLIIDQWIINKQIIVSPLSQFHPIPPLGQTVRSTSEPMASRQFQPVRMCDCWDRRAILHELLGYIYIL
jgi:hypothetical protein